ncbi:molybdenum cofactor guanylyltransferase [Rhodococcus antarcticus]|uniref:Molybdenum cofactor guanylyltransferase n=1 Tax=Rhodococcus antarcticus TaxID=2987751 RepID=A0ABY6NY08_9NOCA|nr:molybdenum cofactor guanylyltransferase [Rhodococcus antarcticus]UZJ23813.1 molybdenum cofactor guanylyltransferase [Rhodococcus antarcticus]
MGTDKALLELDGVPSVVRVVAALAHLGRVVVVAAQHQPLPRLAATVVRDERADTGPLHGLAIGLRAAAGAGAGVAVVCATDLPLLHPAVVDALLARLGDHDVLLPVVDGHEQPLAAVYRTSLAPVAGELVSAGERRLLAVLAGVDVRRIDGAELAGDPAVAAADPHLHSLRSANTPQEWSALAGLVAGR